jgi:hypothetical protein
MTECDMAQATVYAILGIIRFAGKFRPEELELTTRHVKHCASCIDSLSPKERTKFLGEIDRG